MAIFSDVFVDVTRYGTKIPQEDYLPAGLYQIIDQGQNEIAGYSNNPDGLFTDVPAIIFGDHTRVLKYVDKPLFLGADGVKLLKAKDENANYKYLYYALCSVRIPDTGYNRHFKWLKEAEIPLPDANAQAQIAAVLDNVNASIALRKRQLVKLDELVKARFVEMFGDPAQAENKWQVSTFGDEFYITSGGTPNTKNPAYWEHGTIPWIGSNMCQDKIVFQNDGKHITKEGLAHSSAKVFESGTVLVALVGATIGKTALLRFATATNQNVAAIDVNANKDFTSEYVYYHLQFLYPKFQELGNGTFKMANQTFIRALPILCPPYELQVEFSDFM